MLKAYHMFLMAKVLAPTTAKVEVAVDVGDVAMRCAYLGYRASRI